MSFSLSKKVALVTGSSRGLGYGVAKSLGNAGAKVVINYLNDQQGLRLNDLLINQYMPLHTLTITFI